MLTIRPAFFLCIIMSTLFTVSATEPHDSVRDLDEVTIKGIRRGLSIGEGGSLSIDTRAMGKTIRMFGEADPLRYAKIATGAQTGSDYSSGMSVQGTGYSHTLFRVGDAPIWFPYRFGGIFSTFNGSHYTAVRINKSNAGASSPDRLGALVELRSSDKIGERTEGEVNAGMTASSLSLRVPVGKRISITGSGRISYLDALYGKALELKDQKLRYSFSDASLTAVWRPNQNDLLKIDGLINGDRLKVLDRNFTLDTYLNWMNAAVSAQWTHIGKMPWQASLSWSGFKSRLKAEMPGYDITVPSSIWSAHAYLECTNYIGEEKGEIKSGFEGILYLDSPQQVATVSNQECGYEGRIYGEWIRTFESGLTLDLGLKGSGFISGKYKTGYVTPTASIGYKIDNNIFKISSSIYPQYVHQTGFADIGLASNFWYMAREASPAQLSWSIYASWQRKIADEKITIMIEPYYKRILHEPSYTGIVLDLIDNDYRLEPHLVTSNGYNAGFEFSLVYRNGPIDIRGMYSLGYARRRFPSSPEKYLPSVNESLHNLNVTGIWKLSEHWNLSSMFTLSSGRPYTPIEQVYMIGENIMTVYGDMNSTRMPLYHRLDLGTTYRFETGKRYILTHYVNLSILNAYAHKNIEMSYYRFSAEAENFYLHRVPSLYRFIPSVSYTIEF